VTGATHTGYNMIFAKGIYEDLRGRGSQPYPWVWDRVYSQGYTFTTAIVFVVILCGWDAWTTLGSAQIQWCSMCKCAFSQSTIVIDALHATIWTTLENPNVPRTVTPTSMHTYIHQHITSFIFAGILIQSRSYLNPDKGRTTSVPKSIYP
jgi:hypothetical protein